MAVFSRRIRFLAALIALAGVLFAQLAMAAYACPVESGSAQEAGLEAPSPPCCGKAVDADQPALCHAHCQQGDQSLDKPSPSIPPLPAWLPMSAAPPAAEGAAPAFQAAELPSLLARVTAPALAISHCRLRF